MIEAVDDDPLLHEFGILLGASQLPGHLVEIQVRSPPPPPPPPPPTHRLLDHFHNLLLDLIQVLRVSRRRAADDVVDLEVVIFPAEPTSFHHVRELHKDRVLLHDPLDVLAADADDAFVVLVRHVERDRGWHLLLHEIETALDGVVTCTADVHVQVVLAVAVEDDLHIACRSPTPSASPLSSSSPQQRKADGSGQNPL